MNKDTVTVYMSDSIVDKVDMSEFYSTKSESDLFCSIFFNDDVFHFDLEKITINRDSTTIEFLSDTDFITNAVRDEKVEKVVILCKEENLKEMDNIRDVEIEIKLGQNSHYITMTIQS